MASAWFELADISMISTSPDRVISRIWSRYSSSVLNRTSPECISGERPGAPKPERHVGVLGVGDDELAAARIGVDCGELAVEGLLHGSQRFPWLCPETVTRDDPCEPLPPPAPIVTRTARAGAGLTSAFAALGHARRSGLARGLGVTLVDRFDGFTQDLGRMLQRRGFFRPELDLELAFDPFAADHRRDRDANIADAVGTVDKGRDRQDAFLIERDGVDDFADRDADGEARAPFELDHLGTTAASAGEERVGDAGIPAGESLERQAGGLGRRPDRHHAIAVLAQDQGRHLGGRELELFGDQAAKPGGVELGSQADHLAGGQVELPNGQIRQDIDRVGNDQHDRVALDAGRGGLAEDAQEELDVAIDQVEPALVRLAAQAGGDDDDVAFRDRLISRRPDPLIGDERRAVEQVKGLSAHLVGVQVDQVDLADDARRIEARRPRTIQPGRRRR